MPFSIGPKTIASIIAGLALIGGIVWVWLTITNLRAENVSLTAANSQLMADLDQAKSVNAADLKALADLKSEFDVQAAALSTAQTELAQSTVTTQQIVTKVIRAPASEKACFAGPLAQLFDSLYAKAPADGADADPGREDQGGPGVLRNVQGLAGGSRPVIDIHPSGR